MSSGIIGIGGYRAAPLLRPLVVCPRLKVVGNVPRRNSVNSSKFLLLACHRSSTAHFLTASSYRESLSSRSVAAGHCFNSSCYSQRMSASDSPDCGANAFQLDFTVFSLPRTLQITSASKSKRSPPSSNKII